MSKNIKILSIVFRIILSWALLFFIYRETGWATALAFFLLMAGQEFTAISRIGRK